MEKMNLLILSDDLDLRIEVKNLVADEAFAISGYSGFTAEGKTKIVNKYPEIVLCAVRGEVPDAVFSFVQDLLAVARGLIVILVNDNITVDLVNKAAQYGIRKVLPIDGIGCDAFSENIKTVYTLEQQRILDTNEGKKVRCKALGFFGGKGGTGKTTLAIGVAASLAKAGKRVMLLDLDLQFGDVSMALDLDTKNSIVDLVQDRGGITIENINGFAVEHSSGMSVLCAPKSSEYAEFVTAQHIERIIDIMRPYYEYIIVDLPSAFNDAVITACENCEEIFLVYNNEILSLNNAKVCYTILDQLHQRDKIRFVLNRVEKSLIKPEDFTEMFQTDLFAQIPADYSAALTSINKGMAVTVAQPKSVLAKGISELAEKIIEVHTGIVPVKNTQPKKKFSLSKKQK
ncbi:MAG: AAA family ATPase [Clostridia bacterium]|nr:AAA family ATPase [Clostridia bacterium]